MATLSHDRSLIIYHMELATQMTVRREGELHAEWKNWGWCEEVGGGSHRGGEQ